MKRVKKMNGNKSILDELNNAVERIQKLTIDEINSDIDNHGDKVFIDAVDALHEFGEFLNEEEN